MKSIKYISFVLLFLLNIVVLYFFSRQLYIYYNHGAAKELAESIFDNAREIYMVNQSLLIMACCLILFFSLKNIKSTPLISFSLMPLPILYFMTGIAIQEIKRHTYHLEYSTLIQNQCISNYNKNE